MSLTYFYVLIFSLMVQIKEKKVLSYTVKHSEECALLLESFATASARFIFCTLQNSRPIHICCMCVNEYNEVIERHDEIVEAKHNRSSTCNESLINEDSLEVIERNHEYISNLWSRGQCKNCIENKNDLSNTTKEFIKLYADTNQCLENQYNKKNNSYNPDVCHVCSKEYYAMSKFYAMLKETMGNGNVCMDIVDSVNVTQNLWSNILHCGKTMMRFEIPLIAISSVFCIIPIFFYVCAWKFTKIRSADVFNQNRVSQRFTERWRSRTASSISN